MAVFSLNYNNKPLESFPIGMGDTFMIGRQSANDIVIDNLAVSFHHAAVKLNRLNVIILGKLKMQFLQVPRGDRKDPKGLEEPYFGSVG